MTVPSLVDREMLYSYNVKSPITGGLGARESLVPSYIIDTKLILIAYWRIVLHCCMYIIELNL